MSWRLTRQHMEMSGGQERTEQVMYFYSGVKSMSLLFVPACRWFAGKEVRYLLRSSGPTSLYSRDVLTALSYAKAPAFRYVFGDLSRNGDLMFEMILPRIQKIRNQRQANNVANYEIAPLERGFGVTVAHALRRVLISSLPGTAVVALKIERISGVEEEIVDLVLNIKRIRLRCDVQNEVTIHLNVDGERKVTADDITVPTTVEIINPDLHIATLSNDQAHLKLALVVQRGRGYIPVEAQGEPSADMIPIDAIYSPVQRATYTIEHTLVGEMVNFDKVLFTIETDGTLKPDEALRQSASILRDQFLAFTSPPAPVVVAEGENLITSSTVPIPWNVYNLPLKVLDLPVRSYTSLTRSGITKVGQILVMDEVALRSIRNIGDKSISIIIEALQGADCFPLVSI